MNNVKDDIEKTINIDGLVDNGKHPTDISGKSTYKRVFIFNNNDYAEIVCYDMSKKFEEEGKYDRLVVSLGTKKLLQLSYLQSIQLIILNDFFLTEIENLKLFLLSKYIDRSIILPIKILFMRIILSILILVFNIETSLWADQQNNLIMMLIVVTLLPKII